jgi:hypothetical protein
MMSQLADVSDRRAFKAHRFREYLQHSDLIFEAIMATKIGGEILVNTATQNDQSSPQITTLQGGGFVITWTDASQGVGGAEGDSSGDAVKAQVFAADGTKVGRETLLNTATQNDQEDPQIAAPTSFQRVVLRKPEQLVVAVQIVARPPLTMRSLIDGTRRCRWFRQQPELTA